MQKDHEFYIQKCFDLAKNALGKTSPNPLVGSVIVKNDHIIATGFHRKSGEDHAEIDAIKNATQDIQGATLYCNLEPCCHTTKKTPPCTDKILKSGISKVVISNLDPNPKVAGSGVKILQEAGIKVIIGILENEGALLNEVFFTHITKKRPFIHLKWAQTLDGRIATSSHNSKWITGTAARENSHKERDLYDAVMVGAGTVNKDNPSLTIRYGSEINCKKRIIISPSGDVSPDSKVFCDEYKEKTIIVTNNDKDFGVTKLNCSMNADQIDLDKLLHQLYQLGISSIYVEGGTKLLNEFLINNLYDRVSVYIAPKLLGPGLSPFFGAEKDSISESICFNEGIWTHFNQDILFQDKRNLCLQD